MYIGEDVGNIIHINKMRKGTQMQIIADAIWNIIEHIVVFILKAICKIIKKELSDNVIESFLQFVKFGIVGVSNTVISYVLYAGSLLFLNGIGGIGKYNYLVAQIIAFVVSVLWSFYWNNKMVFVLEEGKHRSIWKSLLKTYISYSFTGLFLNSILLILWVDIIGISEFVAPIINLLISVPLNFIINKLWAFKTQ